MRVLKRFLPLIVLVLLSIWAIKPFFAQGFFPMHDDTQVQRVFEMTKSLKLGTFPVRWVPDLGYGLGYPIFNFYAPFAYYIGSFFSLIGFDALVSTKIMMVLGIVLAGIFMYLLAKNIFGALGGITSALFYVYAPYHALDIYVRGDVAEFWAYAFLPLVFLGIWNLYKKEKFIYLVIGALGYAGIILSHNLTAMMTTPFIFLFALILSVLSFKKKNNKNFLYFLGVFVLGIVISAFYWFPALSEMKNTNISSIIGGIGGNFVCVNQLWSSPWGYGGSIPGCVDGLSFMAGKLHILMSILSAIGLLTLALLKKKTDHLKSFLVIFFFLGFIFSLFLTLEWSQFIWNSFSLMQFFQFPWRFLLTASFFSSLLAGSVFWMFNEFKDKRIGYVAFIVLSVGLIILNAKFFVPQKFVDVNSDYYTNEYGLKWTTSKISDEYLPKGIKKPSSATQALNNKQIFSFDETPIEKASDLISLAGVIVLIAGIILSAQKRYE